MVTGQSRKAAAARTTPPATAQATATRPPGRGKHHFGYKSKAYNVLDDHLCSYPTYSDTPAPAPPQRLASL